MVDDFFFICSDFSVVRYRVSGGDEVLSGAARSNGGGMPEVVDHEGGREGSFEL